MLGIIVKPALTAPFAISIGGTAIVTILYAVKQMKFQARVSRAVTKNVTLYKTKVAQAVPKEVLDAVMGNVPTSTICSFPNDLEIHTCLQSCSRPQLLLHIIITLPHHPRRLTPPIRHRKIPRFDIL